MAELDTGTLFIKSKKLEETDDHVSRLSIRCSLKGEQYYRVGGNDKLVTPKNYLVVNQGQHYQTSFSGSEEHEMILVAFKPGFAEELHYSLASSDQKLLDDPFHSSQPVMFFEKTYDKDAVIVALFAELRKLMDADIELRREKDLDSIYSALLSRLIQIHGGLQPEVDKLSSLKQSTRAELFKRLSIAKDFMLANLDIALQLQDVSQVASLSVHHLKREFKNLFGISPHQFLVRERIKKAAELLAGSQTPVEEVCISTGFQNTSSFIRLFKQHTGTTPGAYRRA